VKEPAGGQPGTGRGTGGRLMAGGAGLDRFAVARSIADAVLYEGYVLYPYRASSRKNQLRWQFGVLVPPAFSEADGSERWSVRTECLLGPETAPVLTVRIRALQVQHRRVEVPGVSGEFVRVDQLDVDGHRYIEWDEAIEHVVDLPPQPLGLLTGPTYEERFAWDGGTDIEVVHGADGAVAGRIVRQREPIEGRILVTAAGPTDTGPTADGPTAAGPTAPLVKVTVTVENTTPWAGTTARRDDVMGHSLVAVHTMLAVDGSRFVSLLDPPAGARDAVDACHNDGAFPVLIGDDDIVLSSPIILYDHPEVAPESSGDLYDATEIDEILALRVLTLTDEEKSEARGTDPRAAAIIDRIDDFTPEMWDRLHGTVRALGPAAAVADGLADELPATGVANEPARPWWDPGVDASVDPWTDSMVIAGVEVHKGSPVRLHPSHRSDAQDLFLDTLTATVAGIFTDVDGDEHVAVTVDDDPANTELSWQGRYLFFHPDEVEPLPRQDAPR
jgi:hypothetical protein